MNAKKSIPFLFVILSAIGLILLGAGALRVFAVLPALQGARFIAVWTACMGARPPNGRNAESFAYRIHSAVAHR